MEISIHASAKEATRSRIVDTVIREYFNPRLREGGDITQNIILLMEIISIHASAKEATFLFTLDIKINNFNPRLREGGDA